MTGIMTIGAIMTMIFRLSVMTMVFIITIMLVLPLPQGFSDWRLPPPLPTMATTVLTMFMLRRHNLIMRRRLIA